MALRDGTLTSDYANIRWNVKMSEAPKPRETYLSREEARLLVDSAAEPYVRLFCLLALTTAALAGAILDLTWDRVNLETGHVDFKNPEKKETRKRRVDSFSNSETLQALREAKDVANTDHVIEKDGRRLKSIRSGMARLAKKAGLPKATPHVLKHTAISLM